MTSFVDKVLNLTQRQISRLPWQPHLEWKHKCGKSLKFFLHSISFCQFEYCILSCTVFLWLQICNFYILICNRSGQQMFQLSCSYLTICFHQIIATPDYILRVTEVKMNKIMILTLIKKPLLIIKLILSFLFLYDFVRCVSFGSKNNEDRIIKSAIKDQMGQGTVFSSNWWYTCNV